LYWLLDVAIHEDSSRKRLGNAAENYFIICRIAPNLIKHKTSKKSNIKGKDLLQDGMDSDYLLNILKI
jgi:hypothetical protein